MGYTDIAAGENLPLEFNVIVEMSAYADPVKYDANHSLGMLRVNRFMTTSMRYPANYGFVPRTLATDGTSLDALVITPFPVVPGALIECRPLGLIKLTDEAGWHVKLLAVPLDTTSPMTVYLQSIDDLPEYLLHEFRHFFVNYKVFEHGHWSKFDGWGSLKDAQQALTAAAAAFENRVAAN